MIKYIKGPTCCKGRLAEEFPMPSRLTLANGEWSSEQLEKASYEVTTTQAMTTTYILRYRSIRTGTVN